ncbi:hypothetical protein AB0F72_24790 [Actinoplanes sp. NPDC023936]|uniref:hypothetical protein n=1 Tax=Actinoplanes sp. NPDC023936 TaxID=3154910 RepID=UPI0033D86F28
MRIPKNLTKRVAVAASLAAGLAAPVAVPMVSPAAAAPAPSVAVPPPPEPVVAQLAEALLTEKDLGKGWAAFDGELMDDALPGMLEPGMKGGDPCTVPESPPLKDVVEPPKGKPDPAGPSPVKGKPPVGGRSGDEVSLEYAAFLKDAEGSMLLETIAGTGSKRARTLVEDTREMLKRCPTIRTTSLTMTMSPLTKFPKLGDDSQAIDFVATVKDGAVEIAVPGKMSVVAVDEVYLTVTLVGAEEPERGDLKKFTKRALHKIDKVL